MNYTEFTIIDRKVKEGDLCYLKGFCMDDQNLFVVIRKRTEKHYDLLGTGSSVGLLELSNIHEDAIIAVKPKLGEDDGESNEKN